MFFFVVALINCFYFK